MLFCSARWNPRAPRWPLALRLPWKTRQRSRPRQPTLAGDVPSGLDAQTAW
jgi:hypothetical protein